MYCDAQTYRIDSGADESNAAPSGLAEREGHEYADDVELDERVTWESKATISAIAKNANMRIPLLKASRSPLVSSWRGM